MNRALKGVVVFALLAATAAATLAQPAPNPNDQQRLEEERVQALQEMARQQAGGGNAFQVVLGGDGRGSFIGPGAPGGGQMPEELILVTEGDAAQLLFVIRGHTLYRYIAGADGALQAGPEVDLRTPEETARAEEAGEAFVWPDPAMVPVRAEWSARSNSLIVLRGGLLMQFSPELECLAEFDLRSEREKQQPQVRVLMRPAPPAPPAAPGPPPPPGAPRPE